MNKFTNDIPEVIKDLWKEWVEEHPEEMAEIRDAIDNIARRALKEADDKAIHR